MLPARRDSMNIADRKLSADNFFSVLSADNCFPIRRTSTLLHNVEKRAARLQGLS